MNISTPKYRLSKRLLCKVVLLFILLYSLNISAEPYKNLIFNEVFSKIKDSINLAEKVFVHYDKPYYTSGEYIWFKVYLVNAKSNQPNAISKIVHVDLIDQSNKIILTRAIKINAGGGAGEFPLPLHLKTGWYSIRAYSNVMRNFSQDFFFHSRIKIIALNDGSETLEIVQNDTPNKIGDSTLVLDSKPDVQFFPEGGHLVNDLQSVIAVKAMDKYGKSIDVLGYILDRNGIKKAVFQTVKFGFGKFMFTPKEGQVYKASIAFNGEEYSYELPMPLKNGVVLGLKEEENNYAIALSSSLELGIEGLTLIAHQRGDIVSIAKLSGIAKNGVVKVPKSNLQEGIVQFVVFNEKKQPLSERLAFVKKDMYDQLLKALPSKLEFNKRELVEIDVSFEDETNEILESSTSVAVTDISVIDQNINALDIRSQLLLKSELRGSIEYPGYYFYSDDPNREKVLDLLMLTQGWRKFLWNDPALESSQNLKYPLERGITFSGTVKDFNNRSKIANSELSLTFQNNSEYGHDEATTLENGHFSFGDYDFMDTTAIVIQAKKYKLDKKTGQRKNKKPQMGFYIEMDSFEPPEVVRKHSSRVDIKDTFDDDYLERSKKRYHFDTINPFVGDYVQLDEVELPPTKAKEKKNYSERTIRYNNPTHRVDFDEIEMKYLGSPLLALRSRYTGITILGMRGEFVKMGRGPSLMKKGSPPLFLLNGMPVGVNAIINLSISEVSWIDILMPAQASLWGSRGRGGVLAVYLKDEAERMRDIVNKERAGIINFVYPGYYKARKFYEPNYENKKPEHGYPDYRSTIYWDPEFKIDSEGVSKISFYAADLSTTYKVEIQGITTKGGIIKKELFIDVD